MRKSRIKLIATILVLMFIVYISLAILVSCNSGIKIEAQPSLITEPVYFDKSTSTYKLLNNGNSKNAPNPIDFNSEDKKMIVENAWKNMNYVPFMLLRQSGDVVTFSAGTKVIQSVSTYRMAIRSDKVGKTDSGDPGLEQSINYLQSNSVTSQGIPGVDIRLMTEVLRLKTGQYVYRQGTDKNNIKLDPTTSEFYNMSGRWEIRRTPNINLFNQICSKDDPNKIISYVVQKDSIDSVQEIDIKEYKQGNKEYDTLRQEIAAKTKQNVHVYKIKFNPKAWEGTYLKIMYDMLHLGGQTGEIQYLGLEMYMEIWDNGVLRQLDFTEKYDLDLGALKANATLDSNIQFSYKEKQTLKKDEPELDWQKKFLHRFKKRFKNDKKPPISIDKSKLK